MALSKKPVNGMKDILPAEMEIRDYVTSVIKDTYRSFGFTPIETPCMENIANLTSKQGGENEKLIFKVMKRGEKLNLETAKEESDVVDFGMRYDLTVPLSRYYSNNANNLPSPFKALQMGSVWRADRPQRGRYRQFTQCDIDILGEPSNLAEIELITATTTTIGRLGFENFEIRINERRILKAMAAYSGFAEEDYDSVFITLDKMDKIGVEGVVTALHEVPNGEIWTLEAIEDLRDYIESFGLRWSVVESLPVCEAVKYAGSERDRLIENYKISLANLGKAGIRTVCYNFMPVIDWIRTDLQHPWEDGTSSLYFDRIRFAYFDLKILERENAEADYSPEELDKVAELDKVITEFEKAELVDTIIVKTQGFVNGNIKEGDKEPVTLFKRLLALYKGIDREALRENMRYFLSAIMPVCEEYGVNMCVHPDDPPFQVLGLPRIVTDEADIAWILSAVDNPHNGLTFCAGSLSAGEQNDTRELARKFARRTHFVHLRSTKAIPGGNFIESSHLEGRGHLIDLIRIFEKENPGLPMRVDHGRMMLGDEDKGYNAGYSFHGRMLALAQVEGMLAVVDDELYGKSV